jgi:hypothetical protein
MRARSLTVAAAILASIAAAGFATSAGALARGAAIRPTRGQPALCGDVKGASFKYTLNGGRSVSGDEYSVEALGISCASAKTWVAGFTKDDPKTNDATLGGNLLDNPKGTARASVPVGFKCIGKSYTYARHEPPTISGTCLKGPTLNPTGVIYWATVVS